MNHTESGLPPDSATRQSIAAGRNFVAHTQPVYNHMLHVALLLAAGIYPEGHWKHATKLTPANFEGFVESQVDAGKTLFVRWIASEG